MKVAVTSKGKELDSEVDPRFGRCKYFLIVDTSTMEFDAVMNESAMASGGAGPQASQTISGNGAGVVLTGNVGPNAYRALEAAGILIITGCRGTVREMVEKFKSGELEHTEGPNVGSHAGFEVPRFRR
ncbi:MAG: NifB/NifX family molybdenum-iron cluster-binding protein [Thermoplasmatota archaeon]